MTVIDGSFGNNNLQGTSADDTITGFGGSDTIYGMQGNDILIGGVSDSDGRKYLVASNSNDGDDVIYGNDGDDTIYGNLGNDTLYGNEGDDILLGCTGNDVYIFGRGDGTDLILDDMYEWVDFVGFVSEDAGIDTLEFGNDITLNDLSAVELLDKLIIQIKNTEDSVSILYKSGSIAGGSDNAVEYFNVSGISYTYNNLNIVKIRATTGDDNLTLSPLGDKIGGLAGNDVIHGKAGDDILYGDAGNDTLYGDADNDTLYGGGGNNTLYGGDGDDILDGWGGYSVLDGGAGDDELRTGGDTTIIFGRNSGHDYVRADEFTDSTRIVLGEGISPSDIVFVNNQTLEIKGTDDSLVMHYLDLVVELGVSPRFEFANGQTYSYGELSSADIIGPTVSSFNPSDEETGVTVNSNIVLTFSEAIQRGSGNIVLKTAAGTVIETYSTASSSNLAISDNTLTINPSADLASATGYKVEFAAGSIKDLAGNSYDGTPSYNFTTGTTGQIWNGTNGNDTLPGGPGNDTFNGGDGVDTVVLSGLPCQYKLNGNSLTGPEGLDIVSNIEQYRFGSSLGNPLCAASLNPVSLIDPDGAGPADSPATDLLQSISDLYVAYFNRAPDITGLMYWFSQISTGSLTLTTTAQSFTDSPEYQATYPAGQSNRDFINTIYLNLFDRAPDAGGWNYWENDLNHGSPRHLFIYTVIQGAYAPTGGATDKALLNNKHDVSLYYSEQLATHPSEGFDKKIDQVLNRVTADPHTVAQAEAVIDYVIANPITLTGVISDAPTWDAFWA